MAIITLAKLYKSGFNIVAVVPPHKNNNTYNFFTEYVKTLGLPVIDYEHTLRDMDFLKKVRNLEADIAVVCSYNKLFPKEFLLTTKDGFVNTHPSLLPQYRGPNPYSHVIMNDEKETGVTFHFMDESFDTGDIIASYKISVDKNETMGTLFNKTNYFAADALCYLMNFYNENGSLPRVEQPKGEYKYAYSIEAAKGENYINWSKSAREIQTYIRALNPFISAAARFRGQGVKIHTASYQDKNTKYEPGTICSIKDTIGVATGKGILHIKTLQVGTYIVGDTSDFIRIFDPKVGESLL